LKPESGEGAVTTAKHQVERFPACRFGFEHRVQLHETYNQIRIQQCGIALLE